IIFFFQAEDGIRDFHVTGVQTCALPIWILVDHAEMWPLRPPRPFGDGILAGAVPRLSVEAHLAAIRPDEAQCDPRRRRLARAGRSEERRVGKGGRSRWGRTHAKKKEGTV